MFRTLRKQEKTINSIEHFINLINTHYKNGRNIIRSEEIREVKLDSSELKLFKSNLPSFTEIISLSVSEEEIVCFFLDNQG